MYEFKITCDNGTITIVRAKNRSTAIKLFCDAEGYSLEWVEKYCVVRKVFTKKKKSAEELLEEYYEREGETENESKDTKSVSESER
jgi:hypothetical protein